MKKTKKTQRAIKTLVLSLTLVLICSFAFPQDAFAATQHITGRGGQSITNIKSGEVISFKNIKNPNAPTGEIVEQAGYTYATIKRSADATRTYVMYTKKVNSSGGDTFAIKYPDYLKVGSKTYDMVYKVTSHDFQGTHQQVGVYDYGPAFMINGKIFDTNGNTSSYQTTDAQCKGWSDFGFTVEIYESGTTTPANIPGLLMGLTDIDADSGGNPEGWSINDYTPNSDNIWFSKGNVNNYIYYNNNQFYGTNTSPLSGQSEQNAIYCKIDSLTNDGVVSGYYGDAAPSSNIGRFGGEIAFYIPNHTVTYKSINGTTSKDKETVAHTENPAGSENTPNSEYYFVKWTCDKDVTLNDGETIPAGSSITEEQIKEVSVTEDLVFTALNDPYVNVIYKWQGDHPNKPVPEGTSMPPGDYDVDTTYKAGDTVAETNVTYEGKNYPRGTWTFNGWDKNGTLNITEDTEIIGTWTFSPEWNITTSVTNGTISENENNIPDGENRVVTYSPNEGYQLKSVTVNNEPVDISQYPHSVSFTDIHEDNDVKVVYELIPELEIEKSADKEIYTAGDTVTYTVKITQTVPGAEARNVTIRDILPSGITLNENSISGSVEVVSTSSNAYELKIGSLTGELTYTYTAVTAKGTDAEELVNIVETSGENVPGDPKRDDAKVKSLVPKPVITKIVSNENPVFGEEIEYTVSVKEPQEGISLRNAVITDPIPDGIEAVEGSITTVGDTATASFSDGKIIVSIPELAEETVVKFKAKVTAVEGQIVNVATLTGDDIEPLNAEAPITVKEPNPLLKKQVSKEKASLGETVTYTLTASSDIELLNGKIVDTPPEGVEIIADSVKTNPDGIKTKVENNVLTMEFESLNEQVTITYDAKITKVGDLINVAELTAENFPKGPLKSEAKVVAKEPVLVIEKQVNKKTAKKGETLNYTVVAYTKEGILYDAVLKDKLPDSLTLNSESIKTSGVEAAVEATDNEITVTAKELKEGERLILTYKARAAETGTHKNVASLTGSNYTGDPIQDEAVVKVKTDPSKKNSPGTGDPYQILLAAALMAMAGTAIHLLRRRSKVNER